MSTNTPTSTLLFSWYFYCFSVSFLYFCCQKRIFTRKLIVWYLILNVWHINLSLWYKGCNAHQIWTTTIWIISINIFIPMISYVTTIELPLVQWDDNTPYKHCFFSCRVLSILQSKLASWHIQHHISWSAHTTNRVGFMAPTKRCLIAGAINSTHLDPESFD